MRTRDKLFMNKLSDNMILTIETTSNICGVSLISNNKAIYDNDLNNGLNHSVSLCDNIDKALKYNKIDMSNIGVIKVSNGPGSFTGIRIGVSTALGLSKPYNTRIEYIDTLDSLAYNVKNKNDIIISMIDAKCDRAYISLYYSKTLKKVYKDYIVNIFSLCDELNNYFSNKNISFSFVGSAAVNYKKILKNKLLIKYKIYEAQSVLKSSALGFISGSTSLIPDLNYLLSSKAEREKYGNN